MDDDLDGVPLEKETKSTVKLPGFIPSKWETVDPQQVEAQAITTSKWDTLDPPDPPKFFSSDDDSGEDNPQKYTDEMRQKLRDIESKAIQYQDELESGKRRLEPGWSVPEQVEQFRKRLLKQVRFVTYSKSDVTTEFFANEQDSRSEATVDSPLSYMHIKSKSSKVSESPALFRSSSRKRSHSPFSGGESKRRDYSPETSRSSKSSKRNRSRSPSSSPKRYTERSSRSSRYETPASGSSRSRSSPTSSRSSRREEPSPPRHRSDKHKHKHRH